MSSNEEGSCEKSTFSSTFCLVRLSNPASRLWGKVTFCRSVSFALCDLCFFVTVDVCVCFNVMGTERRDWETIFKRQRKLGRRDSSFSLSSLIQAVWEAPNPGCSGEELCAVREDGLPVGVALTGQGAASSAPACEDAAQGARPSRHPRCGWLPGTRRGVPKPRPFMAGCVPAPGARPWHSDTHVLWPEWLCVRCHPAGKAHVDLSSARRTKSCSWGRCRGGVPSGVNVRPRWARRERACPR